MKKAYYNELNRSAAAWLRELILEGHIAPGDVDERSIVDVKSSDLKGYGQCHFFAGIGGWSLALRRSNIPDDAPVWTGSCPCQPFSNAGKKKGLADERHLWPHFFRLIKECKPFITFGEQVSTAIRMGWLDRVFDDLESVGYETAASVLTASIVGAPHIRSRIFFGALSKNFSLLENKNGNNIDRRNSSINIWTGAGSSRECIKGDLEEHSSNRDGICSQAERNTDARRQDNSGDYGPSEADREQFRVANSGSERCEGDQRDGSSVTEGESDGYSVQRSNNSRMEYSEREWVSRRDQPGFGTDRKQVGQSQVGTDSSIDPSNRCENVSFWKSYSLVHCSDGKARRVESIAREMVDGIPDSLGLVRIKDQFDQEEKIIFHPLIKAKIKGRTNRIIGYGNAIVPEAASLFINSFLSGVMSAPYNSRPNSREKAEWDASAEKPLKSKKR